MPSSIDIVKKRMQVATGIALAGVWLAWAFCLYPLPATRIAGLAALSGMAASGASIWLEWIATLALIAIGVVAAALLATNHRFALLTVVST